MQVSCPEEGSGAASAPTPLPNRDEDAAIAVNVVINAFLWDFSFSGLISGAKLLSNLRSCCPNPNPGVKLAGDFGDWIGVHASAVSAHKPCPLSRFSSPHAATALRASVRFKAPGLGFGGKLLSFVAVVGGWSTRARFLFRDSGGLERPLRMPASRL